MKPSLPKALFWLSVAAMSGAAPNEPSNSIRRCAAKVLPLSPRSKYSLRLSPLNRVNTIVKKCSDLTPVTPHTDPKPLITRFIQLQNYTYNTAEDEATRLDVQWAVNDNLIGVIQIAEFFSLSLLLLLEGILNRPTKLKPEASVIVASTQSMIQSCQRLIGQKNTFTRDEMWTARTVVQKLIHLGIRLCKKTSPTVTQFLDALKKQLPHRENINDFLSVTIHDMFQVIDTEDMGDTFYIEQKIVVFFEICQMTSIPSDLIAYAFFHNQEIQATYPELCDIFRLILTMIVHFRVMHIDEYINYHQINQQVNDQQRKEYLSTIAQDFLFMAALKQPDLETWMEKVNPADREGINRSLTLWPEKVQELQKTLGWNNSSTRINDIMPVSRQVIKGIPDKNLTETSQYLDLFFDHCYQQWNVTHSEIAVSWSIHFMSNEDFPNQYTMAGHAVDYFIIKIKKMKYVPTQPTSIVEKDALANFLLALYGSLLMLKTAANDSISLEMKFSMIEPLKNDIPEDLRKTRTWLENPIRDRFDSDAIKKIDNNAGQFAFAKKGLANSLLHALGLPAEKKEPSNSACEAMPLSNGMMALMALVIAAGASPWCKRRQYPPRRPSHHKSAPGF